MNDTVSMSAVNLRVEPGEIRRNVRRIRCVFESECRRASGRVLVLFPELAGRLATEQLDVLCTPFASPMESARSKLERWLRYLPARAYDNGCCVLACNLVWKRSDGKFSPGTAAIFDHRGVLLASRATRGESICRAVINLGEIRAMRARRSDGYFVGRRRRTVVVRPLKSG